MQSNRSEYNRSGNPSRPNNRRDSSDRPHPYRTASDGSFSSSYTSTYTETRVSRSPFIPCFSLFGERIEL